MRKNPCDPRRLDLLLSNRLSGAFQEETEAHLLGCMDCRKSLDKLAGGAHWWAEVNRYLSPDPSADSSLTTDGDTPRHKGAIDLSFLQSSENDGSLGRLGAYEILEIIGQGGMGIVLKGLDPALNRLVAIKVLAAEHARRGTARKRFAREAQAAAAVVHDHVVPVHAVDADATPPYLVMAFIAGQSLQQRIDRSGPLETKEILRIGMQTASGLAAAHAQGLVHRDIKPANIMLENGIERVRITDFGLARAIDDASVTQNGIVAGTPQYMAPEQARGESVDQRADLFALGSVLYTMATGQAPFSGDCGLSVIRQVCDVEPASVRCLNPDVPVWLEGIIAKLHQKDPARRFQSAGEVAQLLESCLAHQYAPRLHPLPREATELEAAVTSERQLMKPRVAWAAAMTVALLVLSVFLFSKLWTREVADANAPPEPPISTLGPSELIALEKRFREGTKQTRSDMDRVQRLFQPTEAESDRWRPWVTTAQSRLHALQMELSMPTAQGINPIEQDLWHLRQRLAVLQQQITRPLE